MSTKIYTLKNAVLSDNGEQDKVYKNPSIVLFCFDKKLSREQVLMMLSLDDAEISVSETYSCDKTEISDTPDYYKYEIFTK